MCMKELERGELAMIPSLDVGIRGQFGISRLRDRTLSAPAKAFLDLLVAHDRNIAAQEAALLQRAVAVSRRR